MADEDELELLALLEARTEDAADTSPCPADVAQEAAGGESRGSLPPPSSSARCSASVQCPNSGFGSVQSTSRRVDGRNQAPSPAPPPPPCTKHKAITDELSGLELQSRKTSSDLLRDLLQGKTCYTVKKLGQWGAQSQDIVIAGVVGKKSGEKKSNTSGAPFSSWVLSDLDDHEVHVYFFGDAHGRAMSVAVGMVVCLLDPQPMDSRGSAAKSFRCLRPYQIVEIGMCAEFGVCGAVDHGGYSCGRAINIKKRRLCLTHMTSVQPRGQGPSKKRGTNGGGVSKVAKLQKIMRKDLPHLYYTSSVNPTPAMPTMPGDAPATGPPKPNRFYSGGAVGRRTIPRSAPVTLGGSVSQPPPSQAKAQYAPARTGLSRAPPPPYKLSSAAAATTTPRHSSSSSITTPSSISSTSSSHPAAASAATGDDAAAKSASAETQRQKGSGKSGDKKATSSAFRATVADALRDDEAENWRLREDDEARFHGSIRVPGPSKLFTSRSRDHLAYMSYMDKTEMARESLSSKIQSIQQQKHQRTMTQALQALARPGPRRDVNRRTAAAPTLSMSHTHAHTTHGTQHQQHSALKGGKHMVSSSLLAAANAGNQAQGQHNGGPLKSQQEVLQELLSRKSRHHQEAQQELIEQLGSKLSALADREEEQERKKQAAGNKLSYNVTAFFCTECDQHYEKWSMVCQSRRHTQTKVSTKRRHYVCGNCRRSNWVLGNRPPHRPCESCGEKLWRHAIESDSDNLPPDAGAAGLPHQPLVRAISDWTAHQDVSHLY